MNGRTPTKIAIVGGAGAVGASAAYALMMSGLASEIVLVDVNERRAEGEAMDLMHGAPFVRPVTIRAGTYADCADCQIVVITAGAAQKPGETRLDLVRKNTGIFRDMIPQIAKAAPQQHPAGRRQPRRHPDARRAGGIRVSRPAASSAQAPCSTRPGCARWSASG